MTTPDFPDFGLPQAHATAISTTGTPLLHGANVVQGANAVVCTPLGFQSPFQTVAKPGYIIAITAVSAGTPTSPWLRVSLFWFDTPNAQHGTAEEVWVIPVTTSGGSTIRVLGKGPTKGQSVTIQLHNTDGAVACTATYTFVETTQHIARDDWRSDPIASVAGQTAPAQQDPWALIMGAETGIAIGASAQHAVLLPLYAGQVALNLVNPNTTKNLGVTVQAVDPALTGAAAQLFNEPLYAAETLHATINLPRCPCQLVLFNNQTVGITGLSWSMQPIELAS